MRLLTNELYRFYKNRNTWVIVVLLFIMTIAYALLISFSSPNTLAEDWRVSIEKQIKEDRRQMEALAPSIPMYNYLSEQIVVNQYRLEHDLPPSSKYDGLTLLNELRPLTTLITLVAIVFAANSIAGEHARGTLKFVITSPIRRGNYLLLKYVSVVMNVLLLFMSFMLFASALGYVWLGTEGSDYYLAFRNGEIVQMPIVLYLFLKYLATFAYIIIVATLAFVISVLFRSAVWAVSISMLLYFTGTTMTQFFAMKFSWIKYSIFANYDLSAYLDGRPPVSGMTLFFSLSIIVAYLLAFLIISYITFTRRDIKA